MAEILNIVSIISYVLAGICAVLAIVFWFIFKIPHVIGDLSGRNARKSIELMRQNNEKAGKQVAKVKENTQKQTQSRINNTKNKDKKTFDETGILSENTIKARDEQATGLLLDDSTTVLDGSGETALLVDATENTQRTPSNVRISMIETVMIIHTEEVI